MDEEIQVNRTVCLDSRGSTQRKLILNQRISGCILTPTLPVNVFLHYFPFPLWITKFKSNVLYVNPDIITVKRSCCRCTPWRQCMVSHSIHMPPLSSWDKHSWYPLNRRPGGPQSCCGHFVEVTNPLPLPEGRPQFLSCPACGPVACQLCYFEELSVCIVYNIFYYIPHFPHS